MTWIALVRHGITDWNQRGVIQGRIDIPLSAPGIAKLEQVRPCDEFLRARWVCSPLQRTQQTAAILNPNVYVEVHVGLIESDWGEFEGTRRDQLAQRIRELDLVPNHGLDFTPPDGESPRMVQQRLLRWLELIKTWDTAVVAVTHKGVIRSAISVACDWDMANDFSEKVDWTLPHLFRFDANGALQLAQLNWDWGQPPRLL